MTKPYRLTPDGMAHPDPDWYLPPKRIYDPKEIMEIRDGTILRVGRKYLLFIKLEEDGGSAR